MKNCAIDFDYLNDNIQSLMNFSRYFETESIHLKYKRQQFLIVDSTKNSFDKHQIKRRSFKICFTQVFVSHVVEILDRCLKHNNQLNQFCITYDIVFVFLTDFLRIKNQNIDININNHTNTLIRKFSEFLIRFEIIEIKFILNNFYDHDIVTTDVNNQKIVFISLIFFKSMNFIDEFVGGGRGRALSH